MKKRIQAFGLVFLTAAIVFFAFQNLEPVPVAFLVWDFNASVSLLVLIPLLAGLVIGVGTAVALDLRWRYFVRQEKKARPSAAEPELPAATSDRDATEPRVKDEEEIGAQ